MPTKKKPVVAVADQPVNLTSMPNLASASIADIVPVNEAMDPLRTSMLSPAEEQQATELAKSIDVLDTDYVIAYGAASQSGIAAFADKILDEARSTDIDIVGEKMTDIVSSVRSINVSGLHTASNFMTKLPIVGRFFNKAHKIKDRFTSMSTHIATVGTEMSVARDSLIERVVMLDDMYVKNLEQFRELNVVIAAGEIKIKELTAMFPGMATEVKGDPFKAQALNDLTQAVDRFDKKIHDLRVIRMMTLQDAPKIRIIQSNNQLLAEKINNTLTLTIPLWKKQFLMALALTEQKRGADLQSNMTNTTNELLRANAEGTKQNSIQIAKENERSIVDIETLEHVQTNLISTLEETLKIQREGKANRADVAKRMVKLESDLKIKLSTYVK